MNKPSDPAFQIDKNSNLAELIEKYPEANEMLFEYGLYCGACFASGFDTLEQGAQLHGMTPDDVDELVQYLKANLASNAEMELNK